MAKKSSPKRLYRSESSKVLAGVCTGLAEYFDLDPTIVRLFFILATMMGGSGLVAYVMMWIFIPSKSSVKLDSDEYIKKNTEELKDKAQSLAKGVSKTNGRFISGGVLILVGVAFLLNNLGLWRIKFDFIWPLFLVALGLSVMTRK
ncbi:PspC domain-containing protein [Patescibacteria group bacterium]